LIAEAENTLPDGLEEGQADLNGIRRPRRHNEKLRRRRCFRSTENRRGDETLTGHRVGCGQALRERDADRAERGVDRPLAQAREHAPLPEYHRFDGRIVRDHGEDSFAAAGIGEPRGCACTPFDERLHLARRAVVDRHFVAGGHQVGRHTHPHVSQAYESDLHALTSLRAKEPALPLEDVNEGIAQDRQVRVSGGEEV